MNQPLLISKSFTIFSFLIISLILATFNSLYSQDIPDDMEEISMLMEVPGYGFFSIDAFYSSDQKVFLDVESFFTTLKITCISGQNGDSLGGFIDQENRKYVIDYKSGKISIDGKIIECHERMLKRMGMVYLESSLFKQAFGISLKFNFRSLLITVNSDFELPTIKQQRIEKTRSNIKKLRGETMPDTTLKRRYHLFKFGALNWSAMFSQLTGNTSDNQFGLGLGAELLFGELDISLNYSPRNQFNSGQQQFQWRWNDNDKYIIRQVQAGKIVSQSISTINSPMYGVIITNASTAVRRATGFYTIRDFTQPDWFVELYLNNSLVDFTKADASGMFVFKVPLVYGYTTITLKFYGPNGEERFDQRIMNVPFNFLPTRNFEYRIYGGVISDSVSSR